MKMTLTCTRCENTGFLNIDQVDDETLLRFDKTGNHQAILDWVADRNNQIHGHNNGECYCAAVHAPCHVCELGHDVSVCDCCGDGENWYGTPGEVELKPY